MSIKLSPRVAFKTSSGPSDSQSNCFIPPASLSRERRAIIHVVLSPSNSDGECFLALLFILFFFADESGSNLPEKERERKEKKALC